MQLGLADILISYTSATPQGIIYPLIFLQHTALVSELY